MTEFVRDLVLADDVEDAARAAAERFAASVADAADVAYATADSPFGPLLLASSRRGLIRVAYPETDEDAVLTELAERVGPRIVRAPRRLDDARRQLDEYFEGRRTRFDVPVDLRLATGFRRKVLLATARIPFGRLLSYSDVARRAGNPRATRAAGSALGWNRVPIVVPCHRVVRTGGDLGGYGGGLDRKRRLLTLEGVLDDADG